MARLSGIRRHSSEVSLPPLPLHPAHRVLAMQVGGPRGVALSAGQAQLVCVARMLLKRAPLVLLDEATAAVDPRTASLIHRVLQQQFDAAAGAARGGRGTGASLAAPLGDSARPTVIQVAHELSAILQYDRVLVMAGGRVVEQGEPQQLAAQQESHFSRLLALQQQGRVV